MPIGGFEPAFNPAPGFGRAAPGRPGMRRVRVVDDAPVGVLAPRAPIVRDWQHPVGRRWDRWCSVIEKRLAARPLAVDLRRDPGTTAWWAGVVRLALLTAPVLLCLPGFATIEAAPLPLLNDSQARELRTGAIHPQITGGGTGRHFAATDLVARLDAVPERATIAINAVIGEHDDLAQMLQRLGLAATDATAVKTLVTPILPQGTVAPGTHLAVTLGARAMTGDPRPLLTLAFRPRFDLAVRIDRHGSGLTLARLPIAVDATPLHLTGAAGGSLYRAARAAGASPDTVQAYLQAIDQYLPLETIAPGDRFELVVAHKRAIDGAAATSGAQSETDAGQDGELLFAGVVRDGKPLLQVMRWGNDGNFFTADALESETQGGSSLLAAPVSGNITSWFGMRRHPILGYVRMHAGVDFAATSGSPVFAVTDGVVSYAGWHGGHGNYVRLAHGGGIDTGYGHMSRIAVSAGARVARGQVIGYVGSTGLSTGPHLHYELFRGGQPVDPLSLRFVPHHTVVNPAEIASFRKRMQQLLALPQHAAG